MIYHNLHIKNKLSFKWLNLYTGEKSNILAKQIKLIYIFDELPSIMASRYQNIDF